MLFFDMIFQLISYNYGVVIVIAILSLSSVQSSIDPRLFNFVLQTLSAIRTKWWTAVVAPSLRDNCGKHAIVQQEMLLAECRVGWSLRIYRYKCVNTDIQRASTPGRLRWRQRVTIWLLEGVESVDCTRAYWQISHNERRSPNLISSTNDTDQTWLNGDMSKRIYTSFCFSNYCRVATSCKGLDLR